MVALWIILGIVASIVLLVGIFLLLPVDLLFTLDEEQGFGLRLRMAGMVFGGKEPSDSENPMVKRIKKALGLSSLEDKESIRSSVEKKGASETLQDTIGSLTALVERVFWLLKRCRIAECKIAFTAGGEDAPLEYGTACAVIYPLVAYFEGACRLRAKKKKVSILCDYDRPKSELQGLIAVRVHIWYLVRALMHIVKKQLSEEGYGK